jgi:hypothetical protein
MQMCRLDLFEWGTMLLLAALLIRVEEGFKPSDVVRRASRFSLFHPPTGRSDV